MWNGFIYKKNEDRSVLMIPLHLHDRLDYLLGHLLYINIVHFPPASVKIVDVLVFTTLVDSASFANLARSWSGHFILVFQKHTSSLSPFVLTEAKLLCQSSLPTFYSPVRARAHHILMSCLHTSWFYPSCLCLPKVLKYWGTYYSSVTNIVLENNTRKVLAWQHIDI